ncbi:TonB-dependent receptor [Paraglaciecola aquimarina]|uniref:TonB-dependent receptor n=1 Tax=Paraglaciecola algarum TaxID=3050085 RepID=A0ABS9D7H3_9ALTE|nr:TonB-dependent receptor [Paraglaciecola sp. G1-23]MCF2948869.1 TonB-dependent receptor [Paraglaciecola sp. G1-23]
MRVKPLTKTTLATSLALILGSTSYLPLHAIAQEAEADVEVISVVGIRSSIRESTRMKRDAMGVVDAISAEDIGKFPDTNLAESLQRITGVSISRNNGEGSKVTIRGFGADKNMVTLNGRMLPTGGTFGEAQGTSRAFDFANLASESVRSLEVFKTGKANITTGGIGGTVNINTTKPIMGDAGFKANVGAKGVYDSTNRVGSDITPELSGIFSFSDDDNEFAISLSVSHQKRNSGNTSADVSDWRMGTYEAESTLDLVPGGKIINEPAEGQLYAIANSLSYNFADNTRVRDNAQLTLQYRPSDKILATVDYTYAQNDLESSKGQKGAWSNKFYDEVVFDTDQDIATAVLISEPLSGTKDNTFQQQHEHQTNTLKSLGVNLEYEVNDRLTLNFDAHDSSMDSVPGASYGGSNLRFWMAAPVGKHQIMDFTQTLPRTEIQIDDSVKGNNDGIYNKEDLGSQMMFVFYSSQETSIQQFKFDGEYEFDEGVFEFGIDHRASELKQQHSRNRYFLGRWGVSNPRDIPTDLVEDFNILNEFDEYDTNSYDQVGFKAKDLVALGMWAADEYNKPFGISPVLDQNHRVTEDMTAAYFQFSVNAELSGMPVNILTGMRYETTDVTSYSDIRLPTSLDWTENNDFLLERDDEVSPFAVDTSYDHLLPSLDFDIGLTDEIKARFSYSQTISRASYGQLRSGVSGMTATGPTLDGGTARASASNPSLVPLQSNNFDVSIEYYMNDTNYVSLGFFEKRVDNFIGTEQIEEEHFGLRDVTNGPRAKAAAKALGAIGEAVTEDSLFVMTAVLDNPADFPNGAADYRTDAQDPTFSTDVSGKYDLFANSSDPFYKFLTSRPVNNKSANIHGVELAGQYFFGESGFGLAANYTIVRGDVGFDNLLLGESQFALTGLSDTANLVVIYEQDGLQARVAYNWRDDYLAGTSMGSARSSVNVEAHGQLDMNVSYQIDDHLSLFAEAINLAEEGSRTYGRSTLHVWQTTDLGARYQVGARYKF